MYHFVKNNTELAISRDSISICGFGGPGFENWNASNCRKPCLPVPRNIFNFLIKKTGSKETNLNLIFKFYLQHVVFKCKYCWYLRSQIQFPILGKRGKQGYQVDHLGGGQLSTKWSAAHKKETFDLWNWWLDYITGKWLGEGMSSLQKNILLSEFATLLHFIAKVYFHVLRHFCSSVKANSTLSKLSPSVLGRRRRPFIALIPNIGPDNLYISFYTLMSTQNQSL